jgi:hypothetical protein
MAEQIIGLMDVVGSGLCVAYDDGDRVHAAIIEAIKKGDKVRLSFKGVEDLTSTFLNAAVGQLYGELSEEELKECLLPPSDASQEDLALLKRVVETAKNFFGDQPKFREAVNEVMGYDYE